MVALGALAAISAGSQIIGKTLDYNFQRQLYNQQTNYPELMEKMRAAGISPAAAAQGISGSPGNSMPSFSGSGSMGLADVISAHASQREAETNKERADIQNQFDKLKMFWQPKLWRSEVNESYSRLMKNASESKYFKELGAYYKESKDALHELRPWNLNQAIQTLSNLEATYNEIISRINKNKQDTRTSSAMEGYYNTLSDKTFSEKLNIDLQGFQQMWVNDLLSVGINPNQPFYENLKRLMFTQPEKFNTVLSDFVGSLNHLDNLFKQKLGTHYKRNLAIGAGLMYLQGRHLKNNNLRSATFRNVLSGIGSVIPFTGGTSSVGSSVPMYDLISGQSAIEKARNMGLILPF